MRLRSANRDLRLFTANSSPSTAALPRHGPTTESSRSRIAETSGAYGRAIAPVSRAPYLPRRGGRGDALPGAKTPALDQAGPRPVGGGRGAGRLRELAQDVGDVAVHRVLAQDERRGDLAVRKAGRDEAQHLGLAPRQGRGAVGLDRRGVVEEPGERAL